METSQLCCHVAMRSLIVPFARGGDDTWKKRVSLVSHCPTVRDKILGSVDCEKFGYD